MDQKNITDTKMAVSKQPASLTCVKDNDFDLNTGTCIRCVTACIVTPFPKQNMPVIKSLRVPQLSIKSKVKTRKSQT